MKRIMLAAVNSGSGKTTVTCALLQYLVNNGVDAVSFKCGPDYIDTMFHKSVIGAPSYNLDSFFMDDNTIKFLLNRNSADISIIEGVMGFYDGINFTEHASSYEISEITETPVILIMNCKSMANSAAAVIKGFLEYRPNRICGVIFNQVSMATYLRLKPICESLGIKPLGYLPFYENAKLENRYLGLVTAAEVNDLKAKLQKLAKMASETLDIDGILDMADDAPLEYTDLTEKKIADVRVAVARDVAFCFYYEDNLRLLKELGAELVEFSPLADKSLPEGIDGLFLGGGYPEIYAEVLAENKEMLAEIKSVIEGGIPCIAECGGFMYLHEKIRDVTGQEYKMAGVIKGACFKKEHLQRFGYLELTANRDSVLCEKGGKIRAHEFHYYDSDSNGDGFDAVKSGKEWKCINVRDNLVAGFPHMNFYANVDFAKSFIRKCGDRKNADKRT